MTKGDRVRLDGRRIAALDMGSNSFHLLVADPLPRHRITRAATYKRTLRLAEPVTRDGELGRDGRRRARAAVSELLGLAREEGARAIVVTATEALRRARDGKAFRDRVRDEHGLQVRLLDGLEEAYLSVRGMAGALPVPEGECLLGLDLGGGSFEVGIGGDGPTVDAVSLPLGAATLASRSQHDPPRLTERAALLDQTRRSLEPLVARAAQLGAPLRAAGTAGTIRDVGRLALALAGGIAPERVRGLVVTRAQLELAAARLASVATAERAQLPGISPGRADLLPYGAVVVLATLDAFGLEQLQLCDWGLREGALIDALSDARTVSAANFAALK